MRKWRVRKQRQKWREKEDRELERKIERKQKGMGSNKVQKNAEAVE